MRKPTRRGFLKGLGGLAIALPWLAQHEKRANAAIPKEGPRRIVVMTYMMGCPTGDAGQWRPVDVGSSFTLPFVTAPLEAMKSRCLFISDIDHSMLEVGGPGFVFGHPAKAEAALTGTFTSGAFPTTSSNHISELLPVVSSAGGANAESIEHRIGRALRAGEPFPSIDLAVDGDIGFYHRAPGIVASRFSFEGRDTPVSLDGNPLTAFNRYFAQVVAPDDTEGLKALRALRERNKSVLDAVRDSFADLERNLGTDDRRRLEEHAARIRKIELDATAGSCLRPTGIDHADGLNMEQIASMQIRQLAQAMACNLAPVGRIEFCNQDNPRFGVAELDQVLDAAAPDYGWHAMIHGDPLPGTPGDAYLRPGRIGSVDTYDVRLLMGYRFFVQQFANLLAELDKFPEGDGTTVLDNTLCIFASDLGDGGGHHHGKKGYILAGNLGGGRTNYHFRAGTSSSLYTPSTYDVNQLLNSIIDMAGITENGSPARFGLGGYIEKAGIPRRIDELFA
jgi:hypothetical protein